MKLIYLLLTFISATSIVYSVSTEGKYRKLQAEIETLKDQKNAVVSKSEAIEQEYLESRSEYQALLDNYQVLVGEFDALNQQIVDLHNQIIQTEKSLKVEQLQNMQWVSVLEAEKNRKIQAEKDLEAFDSELKKQVEELKTLQKVQDQKYQEQVACVEKVKEKTKGFLVTASQLQAKINAECY